MTGDDAAPPESLASEEWEAAADEFIDEVVETFGVDPEDVEITAEREPAVDRDLAVLKARWVVA